MKRTLLLAALLAAAATTPHLHASAGQEAQAALPTAAGVSAEAIAQIEALIAEKESRTGAARKIDSQLIYELRMQSGRPIAPGVTTLDTDVPEAADGRSILDVRARVSPELLTQLRGLGAEIIVSSAEHVRMHLDLDRVEAVAALPEVIFIGPRLDAMTTRMTLQDVLAGTGVGSQSSQGDVAHRADIARAAFGVNGTGVKIGVLSDGVTNLAASQALGDLGPVTVLPGQAGTGDEGTAMLEIIHDVAPGAQLYFATAFGGIASFADNIRALRAAGCDIIVDDAFYFVETPFQDGQAPGVISTTNGGVVVQAVKDVTASGALYFSAAGNAGNANDGTGGTWEGDFVDGGAITISGTPYRIHSFAAQNSPVQNSNNLTLTGGAVPISLFWSDPLGGSANDYDLFRLNPAGTAVAAASVNIQNGTQDPLEQLTQNLTNPRIIIIKKATAQPRFLHLGTNRGRLSIATPGTTHGHAAVDSEGAYGVAATPASGPFPNAFSTASSVETFSSDGPRRIFYDSTGVAITPGTFLAGTGGGKVLQKPDFTAADGVSVSGVGGFPTTFFGTSAAAPHAAAIAALLISRTPGLSHAQVRSALTSSAIDIEAPGPDRDSGAGIIMAVAALRGAGAVGSAVLQLGAVAATENPGDANGAINAGEGARLSVALNNVGGGDATAISATLTSSTPDITITQPGGSAYPNIGAVTGSQSNTVPLLFTVSSTAPCPQAASFMLHVAFADGMATFPFQLALGTQTITINERLDGAAPPSGMTYTAGTGTQSGRLNRVAPASACGTTKAFPGLLTATGTRQFDAYTFNTCATSAPSCVDVTLTNRTVGASAALFDVAYIPSFSPASLAAGYAGDPGASQIAGGPISFGLSVPGGGRPFAVAVHEVNPGLGIGANYSLKVSGACFNCGIPNRVPVATAKDVTAFADNTCGAAASIDDGSSDADGDPLTVTQTPAGPYPLGTTSVLLTVVDPKGATSQASATVTVVDNTAPAFVCPNSIVVPASPGVCGAAVTFTPTATDACSAVSLVSTPASGSSFAVGTTAVTSAATDAAGNAASCPIAVTVVDDQPPAVENMFAFPPILKRKGHKLVDVTVFYNLEDNCGASCALSVTSTELPRPRGHGEKDEEDDKDGDSRHGRRKDEPDWIVVDAHHVRVRAETDNGSLGRVYTITLTCQDAAGNSTVKASKVLVLHDRGGGNDRPR